MTWLQNFVYSFLSGAAEVLPISSRAHGILLLKIFGASGNSDLMLLMMHLGILLALYKICRPQLTRINRALALARIPKRSEDGPWIPRASWTSACSGLWLFRWFRPIFFIILRKALAKAFWRFR